MSDSKNRALVVEDDPSWQQILGEILRDAGLVVDLAENLAGAVELIRAAPHRIAVLDLSLGGSDHRNQEGLQVLDAVCRQDPGCVSIILTGFATVEVAVSAIQEKGAFTCLQKEAFRRAEFRGLIRDALASTPPVGRSETAVSGKTGTAPAQEDPQGWAHPAPVGPALVVEDDAGWRSLLGELLIEAGYRVDAGVSYVEALGRLRAEDYQLVVVDLSLASSLEPGGNQDGYRLLAHTQRAGVPTIIVSGYADPEAIERAYAEYQLFACLEKQDFNRKHFIELAQKAHSFKQTGSELAALTGREREVLALVAQGYKNKEIADALCITPNTVKRHLKSLFDKLGVNTRSAATAIAARAGLVKPRV
ncbi:MAG TPA: response regulator [Anaerolineaceae bacterium]